MQMVNNCSERLLMMNDNNTNEVGHKILLQYVKIFLE